MSIKFRFIFNRDSNELFGQEVDEGKEEGVAANNIFTSDARRPRTKSHPLEPDSDEENGIFADVVASKPKPKTAPGTSIYWAIPFFVCTPPLWKAPMFEKKFHGITYGRHSY